MDRGNMIVYMSEICRRKIETENSKSKETF